MASSASLGASASTSASKAHLFYSHFSQTIHSLEAQIHAAQTIRQLDPLLLHISSARNRLTDATAILPAYDRRQHENNLTQLTQRLAAKRHALRPAKSGFTFRRTPKPPTTSSCAASPGPSKAPAVSPPHAQATPQTNASPWSSAATASTPAKTTYLSIDSRRSCYIPSNRDVAAPSQASLSPSAPSTQHDLHITDLEGCIVDLRPPPSPHGMTTTTTTTTTPSELGALQIRNLKNCIVLTGQVVGSVMIHDVQNCWLLIERCRQFRMHTSTSSLISLTTTGSIATIESCRDLRFVQGNLPALLATAPTPPPLEQGKHLRVQDFDALLSSSHIQSGGDGSVRNWHIVQAESVQRGVERLSCLLAELDRRAKEQGETDVDVADVDAILAAARQ